MMMSDDLYAVVKFGYYRHEIIGIFGDMMSAAKAGAVMILAEDDGYHDALILKFKKDVIVEDGEHVGTLSKARGSDEITVSIININKDV